MVNMRVALHSKAPVLLVADIDRGGIFASLVGTLELLEPQERFLVKGFVVNKFRGDFSLLEPGLKWLEERTGVPVVGVIPYYHDIQIAEEDSVALERRRAMREKDDYLLDIAVIGLPHISNFDDFDPLAQEEGVRLRYAEDKDQLGRPDLIILPGTKCTMADLVYLKRRGLAQQIVAQARSGTPVIGICGGYQMMGEMIFDPGQVESADSQAAGLALLPVRTTFFAIKSTHQVRGQVVSGKGLLEGAVGLALSGYEIHMGQTSGMAITAPFRIDERSCRPCRGTDGCLSPDGKLLGTYIHGLFHNKALRRVVVSNLAAKKGVAFHPSGQVFSKEEQYDRLADLVRRCLDMELLYRTMDLSRD